MLQPVQRGSALLLVDQFGRGPTQRSLAAERESAKPSWEGTDVRNESGQRHPDVSLNSYACQRNQ